jgi:hypothetical protein
MVVYIFKKKKKRRGKKNKKKGRKCEINGIK